MKGKETRPIQRMTLNPAVTVASSTLKSCTSLLLILSRLMMAAEWGRGEGGNYEVKLSQRLSLSSKIARMLNEIMTMISLQVHSL